MRKVEISDQMFEVAIRPQLKTLLNPNKFESGVIVGGKLYSIRGDIVHNGSKRPIHWLILKYIQSI